MHPSGYHGISAVLVISVKQPSSGLLHALRFICVCWPHKRQCLRYPQHLLYNTEALPSLPGNTLTVSPSRLTSTTQPLAIVPGYHTISITGYEPRLSVSGGLRRLRHLLPSSGVENTHIFYAESYCCWSQLSAGGHTESTRLLFGPGLITWALGCTFGTLLSVYSIRGHNF